MAKYTWTTSICAARTRSDAQWFERMLAPRCSAPCRRASRASTSSSRRQYLHRAGGVGRRRQPPRPRPIRASIIRLTVSGIDTIAAELKAKGVEFTRRPHCAAGRARLLHPRPEGVSIELLDRNRLEPDGRQAPRCPDPKPKWRACAGLRAPRQPWRASVCCARSTTGTSTIFPSTAIEPRPATRVRPERRRSMPPAASSRYAKQALLTRLDRGRRKDVDVPVSSGAQQTLARHRAVAARVNRRTPPLRLRSGQRGACRPIGLKPRCGPTARWTRPRPADEANAHARPHSGGRPGELHALGLELGPIVSMR